MEATVEQNKQAKAAITSTISSTTSLPPPLINIILTYMPLHNDLIKRVVPKKNKYLEILDVKEMSDTYKLRIEASTNITLVFKFDVNSLILCLEASLPRFTLDVAKINEMYIPKITQSINISVRLGDVNHRGERRLLDQFSIT